MAFRINPDLIFENIRKINELEVRNLEREVKDENLVHSSIVDFNVVFDDFEDETFYTYIQLTEKDFSMEKGFDEFKKRMQRGIHPLSVSKEGILWYMNKKSINKNFVIVELVASCENGIIANSQTTSFFMMHKREPVSYLDIAMRGGARPKVRGQSPKFYEKSLLEEYKVEAIRTNLKNESLNYWAFLPGKFSGFPKTFMVHEDGEFRILGGGEMMG